MIGLRAVPISSSTVTLVDPSDFMFAPPRFMFHRRWQFHRQQEQLPGFPDRLIFRLLRHLPPSSRPALPGRPVRAGSSSPRVQRGPRRRLSSFLKRQIDRLLAAHAIDCPAPLRSHFDGIVRQEGITAAHSGPLIKSSANDHLHLLVGERACPPTWRAAADLFHALKHSARAPMAPSPGGLSDP